MASGLLSSTAIILFSAPSTVASSFAPPMTSPGQVHMSVSSLVMYGSHSQAFISTSLVLPTLDAILESVGKAAPPMPTMPHSRTIAATSFPLMLR